ncbi:MAG: UDP-glucose 4-epimerase GalE [Clostridia bacterium]|nr:UDP-glucose 4-epimerase GalE [Clostridia bacterium]
MAILVTGGCGYIGSHTVVELIKNGYGVVIVDNLYNSDISAIDNIEKITGVRPVFYNCDIRDRDGLENIFAKEDIEAVIHFAGLKAVGESVAKPLMYYENNVGGTVTLVDVMQNHGVKKIVFSSSATVYGDPDRVPITEDCSLHPTNPYGNTKYMVELILRDVCVSDPEFSATLLRYFNPIGAHESGLIGEKPNGIPNNLMPRIIRVAKGEADAITVFGKDYPTPDGTGVRDYIHVVDLAEGHIKALRAMKPGAKAYNLGTGTGYSVLDIINAFEKASGIKIKTLDCPRRPGDIATCYADPAAAQQELGWKATKNLEEMCVSSWNFAKDK